MSSSYCLLQMAMSLLVHAWTSPFGTTDVNRRKKKSYTANKPQTANWNTFIF